MSSNLYQSRFRANPKTDPRDSLNWRLKTTRFEPRAETLPVVQPKTHETKVVSTVYVQNARVLEIRTTHVSLPVLPTEVYLNIFGYLFERDLLHVRLVCTKWYSLCKDSLLWKPICLMKWKTIDTSKYNHNWYDVYFTSNIKTNSGIYTQRFSTCPINFRELYNLGPFQWIIEMTPKWNHFLIVIQSSNLRTVNSYVSLIIELVHYNNVVVAPRYATEFYFSNSQTFTYSYRLSRERNVTLNIQFCVLIGCGQFLGKVNTEWSTICAKVEQRFLKLGRLNLPKTKKRLVSYLLDQVRSFRESYTYGLSDKHDFFCEIVMDSLVFKRFLSFYGENIVYQ